MKEYKGISREEHPQWGGWKIIDDYYKMATADESFMLRVLEGNVKLQELVKEFNQGAEG